MPIPHIIACYSPISKMSHCEVLEKKSTNTDARHNNMYTPHCHEWDIAGGQGEAMMDLCFFSLSSFVRADRAAAF